LHHTLSRESCFNRKKTVSGEKSWNFDGDSSSKVGAHHLTDKKPVRLVHCCACVSRMVHCSTCRQQYSFMSIKTQPVIKYVFNFTSEHHDHFHCASVSTETVMVAGGENILMCLIHIDKYGNWSVSLLPCTSHQWVRGKAFDRFRSSNRPRVPRRSRNSIPR
jgi:hypothetical protein